VTILVNNAGANRLSPFAYTKPSDWWRLVTVNVLGPITVTFPVLNSMRKHNKGVIINVASRAGVVTGAFSSAYSTSKSALIRATGNIQQECNVEGKDGISLFSLHPGGVKTSMNDRRISLFLNINRQKRPYARRNVTCWFLEQ
jgi:short-subunit dehydrogenase